MHSLMFSLEASLLAPLLEFALSPSGHVEPRRGLALGWLGSVVAGLAVVFGTADRAQAHISCEGVAPGGCNTVATGLTCAGCPPPLKVGEWFEKTCHFHSPSHSCWTSGFCLC